MTEWDNGHVNEARSPIRHYTENDVYLTSKNAEFEFQEVQEWGKGEPEWKRKPRDRRDGCNYFAKLGSGSEERSYLMLLDFCITQL